MSISVHIPSTLRTYSGAPSELSISANTVRAALEQLKKDHPPLYQSVCDETGAIRRHINLFVNDSFLHQRDGLETTLAPGDVLTIMPAVSGG